MTDNIDKSKPLLETVDNAYDALLQKDYGKFFNYLKKSWIQKKKTSSTITESSIIKEMDEQLNDNKTVIAHKLCGAGNGGFFLTFSEMGTLKIPYQSIKIDVESNGVIGHKI